MRAAQAPIQRAILISARCNGLAISGRLEAARELLPQLEDYAFAEDESRLYFDWEATEKIVVEKAARLREGGGLGQVYAYEWMLPRIRDLKNDISGAARGYEEFLSLCDSAGEQFHVVRTRLWLAILEAGRGNLPAAESQLARGRAVVEGPEDWRGVMGLLARAEGAIAAARGNATASEAAFDRALEIFQRFEVPFEEAETFEVWGRCLEDVGDRRAALEKLDRALEIYRRIGASAQWLERALAIKMRAQGSASSDIKASIAVVAASVDAKRPNMSMAAGKDGTVTLMFSDMHDYTGMMERLGDRKALKLVEAHNSIVRTQCEAYGGFEIELRGDGFLVAFPTPQAGVRCAIALHQAFADYSRGHAEQPISVRIGLHTGEAIRDEDKFFGKTVVHAFRIADLARPEEILVSGDVKATLEAQGSFRFADERNVTLKGFSGEYPVARVEWR